MILIASAVILLIRPNWAHLVESSVGQFEPVGQKSHQLNSPATPLSIRENRIRRETAATTSSFSPDEVKWTNINEEVDEALKKVWPLLVDKGYTTLTLPNLTETISITPFLITFSAGLRLSNGHIYNMQGLERAGNAFMTYAYRNKTFQILLSMNIKNMQFIYDFILGVIGISGGGTVEGFLDNTLVSGDLSVTGETGSLHLSNFKVVSFGNLGVRLKTKALLSQISGSILTPITRLFEDHIITSISDSLGDQLSDLMDDINKVDQLEIKKLIHDTTSRLTG